MDGLLGKLIVNLDITSKQLAKACSRSRSLRRSHKVGMQVHTFMVSINISSPETMRRWEGVFWLELYKGFELQIKGN